MSQDDDDIEDEDDDDDDDDDDELTELGVGESTGTTYSSVDGRDYRPMKRH